MQYSNDGRTSGRDASRRTSPTRGGAPRGSARGSYRGPSGRGDARRGAPRSGARAVQHEPGGARRRRSNLTGPDTGYTLHSHRVSFSRRGSFAERLATTDWRVFVALAAIVLVIIVFAVGISSCVRGSTPARSSEGADDSADITSTAAMSDQDGRVAAGVSNSIISQFSTELDRDEQLAQIAKRANEYTDERLLQLALNEPEAIGFVANYLDADKSSSAYTDSVTKGSVPKLFDWDERWGYVTYGDGPIAVTGSGPTTLSMAYMGLTGLNNMTAANFASLDSSSQTSTNGTSTANGSSSSSNSSSSKDSDGSTTSSDSSTTSTGDSALDAMIKMATGAGLTASQLSVSSSNLTGYLSESSVIAVHLKANSLTADEHWALAVGVDSDGSVILFDPTSSSISSRTWAAGTIANYSSSFMLLSVTDESLASLQSKAGSSGTSASGTSTSGANGSATSGSSSTSGTNASGTGSSGTGSSGSGSSTSGTSGSASGTGSSSSGSGSGSGSGGTSSGSGSGSSSSGSTSSGSGNYVGLTKSGN